MKRILITPRHQWKTLVEKKGFLFHTPSEDKIYWDESVCYSFSMNEIEEIEKATIEVYDMFLSAAQHIMDNNLFHLFHIPEHTIPYLKQQWENESPAIYGRFDFCYDGAGSIKLLEFNADTPTSLFEASIIQWYWLQSRDKTQDQFNSIHEKLIDYWSYLKPFLRAGALYFTCIKENVEDFTTTEYLRDCAMQAGIDTHFIDMSEIGYNRDLNIFVNLKNNPIKNLFKLYPYEWLMNESFAPYIEQDICTIIEPVWKMLFSNKAILPILWELYPNNKYLLQAYFDSHNMLNYAKKPILSREGANVTLYKSGKPIAESNGDYGAEGFIFQELCELPDFDNNFPVIGSWIIGQQPAGMGIREANTLITDDKARFIPHYIEKDI